MSVQVGTQTDGPAPAVQRTGRTVFRNWPKAVDGRKFHLSGMETPGSRSAEALSGFEDGGQDIPTNMQVGYNSGLLSHPSGTIIHRQGGH